MLYIELNPVRAGMVHHPREYRWSSYRANAETEINAFLTHHPVYLALGNNSSRHQNAYLCRSIVERDTLALFGLK